MISGSVNIDSNAGAIKEALDAQLAAGLEAVGLTAEGHAKQLCPVDTGRLRNSISHAVEGETVYIGTNVEYAPDVELGTSTGRKPKPYLRPAVTNYTAEYKALIEEALKSR